jgi:hypothetical protein
LNNDIGACFAIAENTAKAKARMLVELAGGKDNLNYMYALEATAQGCGFKSWRELKRFYEQRATEEVLLPEGMSTHDEDASDEVRSSRLHNQHKAVVRYLKCEQEQATELVRAWGLTRSNPTGTSKRKQELRSRSVRREGKAKQQAQKLESQRSHGMRDTEQRASKRPANRPPRESGKKHESRPQNARGNLAAKPRFRPDPLVSSVFLSGMEGAPKTTLRVTEEGQQVQRARTRTRHQNGQNIRPRRPNPLQSNTFLARTEERALRQVRENDDYTAHVPRPGQSAAVTYKKRRVVDGQT